jgi:hypothetical protein
MADSVDVSVAFSCLSRDTATATKWAPAALRISTDSLIAVPGRERERERDGESERERGGKYEDGVEWTRRGSG